MIPSDRPHLGIAAQSHAGETGKNNEDSHSTSSYRLEGDDKPSVLAVVADGIGGHQAGEIASRITVDGLVQSLAAADGRRPSSSRGGRRTQPRASGSNGRWSASPTTAITRSPL